MDNVNQTKFYEFHIHYKSSYWTRVSFLCRPTFWKGEKLFNRKKRLWNSPILLKYVRINFVSNATFTSYWICKLPRAAVLTKLQPASQLKINSKIKDVYELFVKLNNQHGYCALGTNNRKQVHKLHLYACWWAKPDHVVFYRPILDSLHFTTYTSKEMSNDTWTALLMDYMRLS